MTEIKAGYLTKCGGKVKNWKKRWVVLRSNGFLSYHEKKGGIEKGNIDIINSDRLGYVCSINSADQLPSGINSETAFAIVTKERTYTLYAESSMECKDWIACLTRVKSGDSDNEIYVGYPTPTNPKQPQDLTMNSCSQQAPPLPSKDQAPPIPPKDRPSSYPYPVGAYNGPPPQTTHLTGGSPNAQPQQPVGGPPTPQTQQPARGPPMPQPQQPAGGPPMPQPPPYSAVAPPPAAPYPQPGYHQQPYRQPYPPQQPYQQPYRQPYQQPYRQPYQQPYRQPYQQPYYPTKQPAYYPQQRPAYRPPARQQQSNSTTVVAGGMVIHIGNSQQQGGGLGGQQQSCSNVVVQR